MNQQPEPIVIFFAEHGYFLEPRQLTFVKHFIQRCDQRAAAKAAGYPNPTEAGETLYTQFADTIEAWRDDQEDDMRTALNIYRYAMRMEKQVLVSNATEDKDAVYEAKPDMTNRYKGAAGIAKMKGLNAAEKQELTHIAGEISPEVAEVLDNVYKQG